MWQNATAYCMRTRKKVSCFSDNIFFYVLRYKSRLSSILLFKHCTRLNGDCNAWNTMAHCLIISVLHKVRKEISLILTNVYLRNFTKGIILRAHTTIIFSEIFILTGETENVTDVSSEIIINGLRLEFLN